MIGNTVGLYRKDAFAAAYEECKRRLTRMKRLTLAVLNLFYSVCLGSVLAVPRSAGIGFVRWTGEVFFGRLIAPRYNRLIDFYGHLYGLALGAGLDELQRTLTQPIRTIVDCGTGTGFVSQVLAARFPNARIISVDAVVAMLNQAHCRFEALGVTPRLICADASHLPLRSACADLVVAQNTTPFLEEFARVCVPGGAVLFIDSAATLITPVAVRAFRKTRMFDEIVGRTVVSGFYAVAKRRT